MKSVKEQVRNKVGRLVKDQTMDQVRARDWREAYFQARIQVWNQVTIKVRERVRYEIS